jgi:hypothetical protein
MDAVLTRATASTMAMDALGDMLDNSIEKGGLTDNESNVINLCFEQMGNDFPRIRRNLRTANESVADRRVLSMEMLQDINVSSSQAVKQIVTSMGAVNDWLDKVLTHLQHHEFELKAKISTQRAAVAKIKDRDLVPEGGFTYRSIMRNLSIGNSISKAGIPLALKEFFEKIHQIRTSVKSNGFAELLRYMESFEVTGNELDDQKALDMIFGLSQDYLRTLLPAEAKTERHGIEPKEGRLLLVDNHIYIGGKMFYSYAPVTVSGGTNTVTSGVVRTTIGKLDLKEKIPYLSARECDSLLDAVQIHLDYYRDAEAFRQVNVALIRIMKKMAAQYQSAKRSRKDKIDTKPYVVILNMAAGLQYGIHIKAMNHADSACTAAINYVANSTRTHLK